VIHQLQCHVIRERIQVKSAIETKSAVLNEKQKPRRVHANSLAVCVICAGGSDAHKSTFAAVVYILKPTNVCVRREKKTLRGRPPGACADPHFCGPEMASSVCFLASHPPSSRATNLFCGGLFSGPKQKAEKTFILCATIIKLLLPSAA